MSDKPWKVAERNVARDLGGVRNRMSGAVDQLTAGDTVHPALYVEVKYAGRFAVSSLMREVRKAAKAENKLPVLALQEKGRKTRLYVVDKRDFELFIDILREGRQ